MILRNPLGRVQTRAGASDQAGYCRCQGRTRFALGIRFSRVSALMGLWPGGRDGNSERMRAHAMTRAIQLGQQGKVLLSERNQGIC